MDQRLKIRDALATDEPRWRSLWQGYLAFYKTELPAHITDRTWARILDPQTAFLGRVAQVDEDVVGFSISILHEGTWGLGKVCYLEDLFVDPRARGGGVGRALVQDLVDRGRAEGWSSLYWHTRQDNPARRLYDAFVQADDFVRYRIKF